MSTSKLDLAESKRLILGGDFKAAVRVLSSIDETASDSEAAALKGLAHFQLEEYDQAAKYYELALQSEPGNSHWRAMAGTCRANADAGMREFVPAYATFHRDELLAMPNPGTLPQAPKLKKQRGPFREIAIALGTGLGAVATAIVNSVTAVWGSLAGYRDKVWTNWYHRPTPLGVLTLAYMRDILNKRNLKDTYPPDAQSGFMPKGVPVPPGAEHFRTADGTWNNLQNPKEGAAGTRFPRNVELEAIKPETGERLMTPNPREVSRKLLQRGPDMKEVPFLNLFAAAWIQFQNDDWVNHGERLLEEYHEIPLSEDDPARIDFGQTALKVGKTQSDPTYGIQGAESAPITFINEVTHWWDGSQLYGSDIQTQKRLRSGVGGKMRLNEDGTLPRENGIEQSGMIRNWWVGLSMLHTLFVREHNAICDRLAGAHPDWNDDQLFNVARMINAAVMAKIHTVEWTPAILPNPGLTIGLNANWYGILTNLFEKGKKRKTLSEVKLRNPELGGVVGNPIDKHGCHYGLAEEFVEVYRLHSLLPERLEFRKQGEEGITEVEFIETRQRGAPKYQDEIGMADILYSFGNQQPGQLVLNNYPHFLRELSIPGNPLFDLAAVDILRARERGIPRYNEFRRQLELNPITCFEDLFKGLPTDPSADMTADQKLMLEQLSHLKSLYAGVEDLDLLVGTLCEGYRPDNFGFGETLFQIFILNATRRLQADRFYTDCFDEQHYTQEGLDWIDQADLKTVILRHFPDLASTGLGNVTNAFEPWDASPVLSPDRHPLRPFDPAVTGNPSRGDAHQ